MAFILLNRVMKSTKTSVKMQAKRKLETPMAAAMRCKRAFSQASIRETVVSKKGKTKHLKQGQDSVVWLKNVNPRDKESNQ